MRAALEGLEEAIGHSFRNRDLLDRALTHSSHVYEHSLLGIPSQRDNEQLEFLGDSVLGLVISEALVLRYPEFLEGRLSKVRAHLVSANHLQEVARTLSLGDYLQLGRGEEMSGGRGKPTLLANAMEALIAAVYLDGGLEPARRFVEQWVLGPEADIVAGEENGPIEVVDFKTALQELARAKKLPPPRYITVRERGPEHSKLFTIEARVGSDLTAQGEASTKKGASQKAARELYERLLSLEVS